MRNILGQTLAGIEDQIQPGDGKGFPKVVKRSRWNEWEAGVGMEDVYPTQRIVSLFTFMVL